MSPIIIIGYLVILGLAFFLMNNSRKRRAQQAEEAIKQLVPGTEVVTIGGLHGIIESKDDESKTITLDLEGVKVVFDQSAIRGVASNPVLNKTVAKPKRATSTRSTSKTTNTKK